MSWPTAQIKEVARVVGGATPKSAVEGYWGGEVHWATPKDLTTLGGKTIDETPRTITRDGLNSCAAELLPPNSVLFSSRAPIGHVAINTVPMATNQGFKSMIPGPKLDPNFLYWWLDAHRAHLQSLGNGATFKEVSKSVVERVEIPLPPLDEQKRIAAILDQGDAVRRLRQRAVSVIESTKTALFHQMFSQSADKQPLGSIIKVGSGNGLTAKDMRGGDVPVYGGNGINGWHDEGFVDPQTVVIGRVGVYCGAVHITEKKAWVTDNALIVRKLVDVETDYLAEALRAANLNQYAGRSSQPLVSGARIYPVEIPLPTIEDQQEFAARTAAIAGPRAAIQRSLDAIDLLFSSLQHRAFTGKL